MRNRWYHRPTLHVPSPDRPRRVGWLELLYDLVTAATLAGFGDALAADVSGTGFLAFVGLFFPLWFLWTGFTFYSNRFHIDDALHRALTFLQLFALGAMGIAASRVASGRPEPFALAFAAGRGLQLLQYLRVHRQLPQAGALARRFALTYALEAALWAGSTLVPAPWCYLLWAVGAGVSLSIPLSRVTRELSLRFSPDIAHASERYGFLVLIVLGAGLARVLSALAAPGAGPATIVTASLLFVVALSLWWIYFDDVAGSRIKASPGAPFIWVYAHLPLGLGVTAVGVAMRQAVVLPLEAHAPAAVRWLLAGTLAAVFLLVAVIDHVSERRIAEVSDAARARVRVGSAALLVLVASAGEAMPTWVFLALVAAVALAQVVLDLAMAPLADDGSIAARDASAVTDAPSEPAASPSTFMPPPAAMTRNRAAASRRGLVDAIRKGTPNELRRDVFFMLMEASWLRFFAFIGTAYLALNVIFASLYLLDPAAINAAHPDSFADAFFFSVQTMATIGYGVLNPGSDWGNTLVVIESAASIVFTAVATGLTFAKANRPRSSILFSTTAVVTRFEGKPTLMFRVANVRGNDIVDASARVAVLLDRQNAEGHAMRRILDLRLVRDTQLLFALSWTVMHVIDESSPLYGLDLDSAKELVGVIVTMSGHDTTYNQTTYARHFYALEDLRVGHRFVDITRTLDDGRLLMDYALMHATRPE